MTTTAERLDQIVDSAVDCAIDQVEYSSRNYPIDAMHALLQRDSRFPKLSYLDCQLTFDFLLAMRNDIEDVLRERLPDALADALRSELADKSLQVLPRSIDPGRSFKDQVRDAVTDALNSLFPDGKMTPAAEPLFWIAFSLIAFENGSKDVEHAAAWVKHLLGWDAPPPDPSPSSPPPRAALTVVPFKQPKKRGAKKGKSRS
jgi:hypothetical protein